MLTRYHDYRSCIPIMVTLSSSIAISTILLYYGIQNTVAEYVLAMVLDIILFSLGVYMVVQDRRMAFLEAESALTWDGKSSEYFNKEGKHVGKRV